MNTGAANLAWADAFVAACAAAGLRHVVLAPGARSAPLALAALRRQELACHVVSDERAAGYFALGLGKASGTPAAVLCTSGTAAANLLPAVMEANLAGVPLLVLSADRPAEAQGWGANQTVDQTKLYGDQVRAFHAVPTPDGVTDATAYARALAARLVEQTRTPLPGPVHANLPFREPLLPDAIPAPPPLPPAIDLGSAPAVSDADAVARVAARIAGRRGVIVCGEAPFPPGFAAALARLAERLDAPILAEPLAGLRFGAHDRSRVLAHQARFLGMERLTCRPQSPAFHQPEAAQDRRCGVGGAAPAAPEWVLRFGAFPVSRPLERWLAGLAGAHHVLVAAAGRWPDPLLRSDTLLRGEALAIVETLSDGVAAAPAQGGAAWLRAEAEASRQAAALCAEGPLFEGGAARALVEALPAGAHCFVGNSLAIRAFDAFSGTGDKPLACHGNRGASGIDGNLATAAGIAAASGRPVAALLGDQALLHDCGSLALLAGRDAVVVVLDNGGGGIFAHLPFASALPADLFARGWTAAPRVDFAALAAAFGLRHAAAADAAAWRAALRQAVAAGGAWLLRAAIDPAASRRQFL